MNVYLTYFIGGLASIVWIYFAARIAGRAVLRTMNEHNQNKEAKNGTQTKEK